MGILRGNVHMENARGLKKLFFLFYLNSFELVCLNLFFLLSCIPIVTIPLAVAAMTHTLMDVCNDIGSKPLRSYWKTFFHTKPRHYVTVLPLVVLELLLSYGLAIYLGAKNAGPLFWMGCGINGVALAFVTMTGFYLCPVMFLEELSPWRAWKRAFMLACAKLPYTLAALAALCVVWGLCIRYFQQAWIAFVLLVFSYSFLIAVFCANHWVQVYFPKQAGGMEEDADV